MIGSILAYISIGLMAIGYYSWINQPKRLDKTDWFIGLVLWPVVLLIALGAYIAQAFK